MLAVQSNPIFPIIRPLTADDTAAYRVLRQKILTMGDGRYFSDSYTREAQLSETQWRAWCTESPEHCIFGTFEGNDLIGVMMITRYGVPRDRTVEWEAIWLDPHYRRQGIAKLAYKRIQQWTFDQGYDRVTLYIRADNFRSQDIHRKQGAFYTYTKHAEVWADGSVEDALCYMLDLSFIKHIQNKPYGRALGYLETTYASLKHEIPTEEDHRKTSLG